MSDARTDKATYVVKNVLEMNQSALPRPNSPFFATFFTGAFFTGAFFATTFFATFFAGFGFATGLGRALGAGGSTIEPLTGPGKNMATSDERAADRETRDTGALKRARLQPRTHFDRGTRREGERDEKQAQHVVLSVRLFVRLCVCVRWLC